MNKKRVALAAAIMGSFVAGLDSTVVNVALPSIREDLGGGLAGQQWVSNASPITRSAERSGRARMCSAASPTFTRRPGKPRRPRCSRASATTSGSSSHTICRERGRVAAT